MADERKAGRAEALAEMASRIPPQITRPQGESFEAELLVALKKVGLALDPGSLKKLAQAYRALLVVRGRRMGEALARQAVDALMASRADADSVSDPSPLPGQGGPGGASEGAPRPTNGQRGGSSCS